MGAGVEVVEDAHIGGPEGTGFGEHAGGLGGDVKGLRERDEGGDWVDVVFRVEETVVEGDVPDDGFDIGWGPAGAGRKAGCPCSVKMRVSCVRIQSGVIKEQALGPPMMTATAGTGCVGCGKGWRVWKAAVPAA